MLTNVRFGYTAPLCLILALATGCGGSTDRVEVTDSRTVSEAVALPDPETPPMERFGFRPRAEPAVAAPEAEAGFGWETPEGWRELEPTPFRIANFVFGPDGKGECYLSLLPASASAEAHINRWRNQMDQPALDATTIAALPTIPVLDSQAKMIEIEGDYTGVQGPTVMDARLLGAVLDVGDSTLFVKMTGPADLVDAEREAFEAFCRSIRVEQ